MTLNEIIDALAYTASQPEAPECVVLLNHGATGIAVMSTLDRPAIIREVRAFLAVLEEVR